MDKFDFTKMGDALDDGPTAFEAEERVIIALDFGTTFSGIAYCFPNQGSSKVATVVNWPGPWIFLLITFQIRLLTSWAGRPRR